MAEQTEAESLLELPIDSVEPDPDQPRKDMGDLSDLKDTIRKLGLIQPIIVSPLDETGRYRLVAGERRFTVVKELSQETEDPRYRTIRAVVRSVDEQNRRLIQLIENIERKDLDPFEEAETYEAIMKEQEWDQKELADKLGKKQPAISQTVRILSLPKTIRNQYRRGRRVSKTLLLEVAREEDPNKQLELWKQVKNGEVGLLDVRRRKKEEVQQEEGQQTQDGTTPPPSPAHTPSKRLTYTTSDNSVSLAVTIRDGAATQQEELSKKLHQALDEALGVWSEPVAEAA